MPSSSPVVTHERGAVRAGHPLAHRPHRQLRHPRRERGRLPPAGCTWPGPVHHPGARVRDAPALERLAAAARREPLPGVDRDGREAQAMDIPRQIATGDPYPLRGAGGLRSELPAVARTPTVLAALEKLDFVWTSTFPHRQRRTPTSCFPPAARSSGASCAATRRSTSSTPPRHRASGRVALRLRHHLRPGRKLGLDDPGAGAATRLAATSQRRPDFGAFEAAFDWILEPSGMGGRSEDAPGGMPVPKPTPPDRTRNTRRRAFPPPAARWSSPRHSSRSTRPIRASTAFPLPDRTAPGLARSGHGLPLRAQHRVAAADVRPFPPVPSPWARSLRPDAAADLNPADAARLGIAQGTRSSCHPAGSIRVTRQPDRAGGRGS